MPIWTYLWSMARAATTSDAFNAVAEPQRRRILDGPRRLVFDAFTSAAHLTEWCAPAGGKITTRAFDFRPGGVWDATIQGPDGNAYPNHWTWTEIAPPERIVWMYGMGKDDPHPVKDRKSGA